MHRMKLQYKIVMHLGRINSPKLRPRLSPSVLSSTNLSTSLESEVSIKEYGQEASRFLTKMKHPQQQPQLISSL